MKRIPGTASRNYDVIIGPDLLDRAGAEKAATSIDSSLGMFNRISIECGN